MLNEVVITFDKMPDAISEISQDADENAIVYTIDGKSVGTMKESFDSLPKGLYIVKGKKIVCP